MPRQYNLIVYGATGFTGRLVAKHLAEHAPTDLKWAIGGRNRSKLEAIKAELKREFPDCGDIGIAVGEGDTLVDLAKLTPAVITSAGPYSSFGEPLLAACVAAGTDYADLTGETPWVKRMMDKYGKQAKQKNVTIVNMSGFGSVPADIGTFYLVKHARERYNVPVREVTAVFHGTVNVSGGTIASTIRMYNDKDISKSENPFFLSPPGVIDRGVVGTKGKVNETSRIIDPAPDFTLPFYIPDIKLYMSPFITAPLNARVVRRSAALYALQGKEFESNNVDNEAARKNGMTPIASREGSSQELSATAYSSPGVPFRYEDYLGLNSLLKNWMAFFAVMVISLLIRFPMLLRLCQRVLPKPGSGPSEEKIRSAWFHYYLVGKTDEPAPRTLVARVMGGDAAYNEAAKMLAESGILLAKYKGSLPTKIFGGGFLTPATAFGNALVKRLSERDVSFEMIDVRRFPQALKDRPRGYYERNPNAIKQD